MKVLILTMSEVGAGHMAACNNLKEEIDNRKGHTVEVIDLTKQEIQKQLPPHLVGVLKLFSLIPRLG